VATQAKDVPIYQEFVGQIYGLKDIAIRARVAGFLEGVHFEEGARVEKGALLYSLESQPFEADVAAKMSRVAEAKNAAGQSQE
jgi:membrane fusion protein (multidrug efflux system)